LEVLERLCDSRDFRDSRDSHQNGFFSIRFFNAKTIFLASHEGFWHLSFEGCLFFVAVAGQVVTAKRASLDPHTVILLVILHEALPVVREMMVLQIIKDTIVV